MFLSLLFFFSLMMSLGYMGYYQNRNEKAKILTDKEIKEFENDINMGKNVDIKKYVLYEDKDYTNGLSDDIYKVSLKIEKTLDKTIRMIFTSVDFSK